QAGTALAWLLFLAALTLPVTELIAVDHPWLGQFTLTIPLLLIFAARALDGVTGGNISVANAYIADVTTEIDRNVAFGRMAIAQNLGFIVGPAVAGLLADWGDAAPVLVALGVSVVALIAIAVGLPESNPCAWTDRPNPRSVRKILGQEPRDCHEVRHGRRPSLASVLSIPAVAPLLLVHFSVYLAFNFFYVGFPLHSASNLGWSMREVGLFLSYLSVLMAITQGPILGWFARRLSDRQLILRGGLILPLGFSGIATGQLELMLVGAALIALGNGLLWPSLLATLSKAAGDARQGAVQGIAGSSGAMASIAGFLVGGLFFDLLGPRLFLLSTGIGGFAWLVALFTTARAEAIDGSR
ncbi:MAG: MFS transporter, partial [Acidobacteriota bacterium]